MSAKKQYVKPGIVFEDYNTGELSGSPEMIERIKAEVSEMEKSEPYISCPFEEMPCLNCFRREK